MSSKLNTTHYLFLLGCEEGNIELLEWIHNCGFIDMTFENNLSFLLACKNNDPGIVQYLYRNIPKIEFKSIDFMHRLFLCRYFDLIKWIHTE